MLGRMSHTRAPDDRSPILYTAALAAALLLAVVAAPAHAQPPGPQGSPYIINVYPPASQARLYGPDIRSHWMDGDRYTERRLATGAKGRIRGHGLGDPARPGEIRVRGLGRESWFPIRSHWMGNGGPSRIRVH